jgi:hypothetical protein
MIDLDSKPFLIISSLIVIACCVVFLFDKYQGGSDRILTILLPISSIYVYRNIQKYRRLKRE